MGLSRREIGLRVRRRIVVDRRTFSDATGGEKQRKKHKWQCAHGNLLSRISIELPVASYLRNKEAKCGHWRISETWQQR
jgi:hypothetical protein